MKWYGWENEGAEFVGQFCEECFEELGKNGDPEKAFNGLSEITDRDPSRTCNYCGRQMLETQIKESK